MPILGINALHAQGGVIHSNHAPFKPFLLPGTLSHEFRCESYCLHLRLMVGFREMITWTAVLDRDRALNGGPCPVILNVQGRESSFKPILYSIPIHPNIWAQMLL